MRDPIIQFRRGAMVCLAFSLFACAPPPKSQQIVPAELPRNEQIMFGAENGAPDKWPINREFLNLVDHSGIARGEAAARAVRDGFAHVRKRDFAMAIKRFNQAWLLDREHGGAYWGFAMIAQHRNRDNLAAETLYRRAIAMLPNEARLRVNFGDVLGRLNRFDEAEAEFRKAFELNPEVRGANLGLSLSHLGRGELRGALDYAYRARDEGDSLAKVLIPTLECSIEEVGEKVSPQDRLPAICN